MSARRFHRRAAALLAACSAVAVPLHAAAQEAISGDFAIRGATVVLGDGSDPIPGGTVVIRAGKVVAAGASVSIPAGIRVVDGTGKWVSPGVVMPVTDLGLVDVDSVASNDSSAAKSRFSAGLDVAPAIDGDAQPLRVARAAGITRAAIAPTAGNAVFAGQGALITLAANAPTVEKARAFQFAELGEQGGKLAGGSRVAAAAELRNALREALDIASVPASSGRRRIVTVAPTGAPLEADPRLAASRPTRPDDVLLTRFDVAALVPVVQGRQPLYLHVERMADIRAALALRQEFPALKLVLVGAAEGWRVAPEIAAAGVPVIANALTDLPSNFERIAATQSNIGRMVRAGVKVAIGNQSGTDQPRYARQYAGNLVALTRVPGATGLGWGQAFAAISSVPAVILGEGAHYGSLLPGRAADVVLWDGDPLELGSGVLQVWIDGAEQPVDNHQTRLRDRYRQPTTPVLPPSYTR